jgi:hypothetical protein
VGFFVSYIFINMENKKQSVLLSKIGEIGILNVIKLIGGYPHFEKLLPDYFNNRNHKIDLINGFVNDIDPDGYIYFYEIGEEILIHTEEIDEGHTQEDYITHVGDGSVGVSVSEYDEEGEMYDEVVDTYRINLTELKEPFLNKVIEQLVNYYL